MYACKYLTNKGLFVRLIITMAEQHSDTLRVGDAAPEFGLAAANRAGLFTLAEAHARGPAIVEFLRGTW